MNVMCRGGCNCPDCDVPLNGRRNPDVIVWTPEVLVWAATWWRFRARMLPARVYGGAQLEGHRAALDAEVANALGTPSSPSQDHLRLQVNLWRRLARRQCCEVLGLRGPSLEAKLNLLDLGYSVDLRAWCAKAAAPRPVLAPTVEEA